MNRSSRSLGLPREGAKVRLIGLKNPDLNEKIGTITSYSRDGERVMISLMNGTQGLVKVKPKQIELLEEPSGRGRAGRSSSRQQHRSSSRDPRHRSQSNQRLHFSQTNMRRVGSANNFGDNASQSSGMSHGNMPQEVMETLRSADAMFELADTSGDGTINQDEFEFYMKKHTNHDNKMIRDCFFMIDADDNGNITRDEVRNAFLTKRREVKGGGTSDDTKKIEDELLEVSRDADALFEKADYDGSGELDVREFRLYMKRNTSHSDAVIHQLFNQMDVDKDGYITREEVRNAYIANKKGGGGKKSLMDLLGLEDDDMEDIEDDVYNMFFLSDIGSSSFWFAILVFLLKLGLIIIIAIDLYTNHSFPDSSDVVFLVKTTQFLLLPVNVAVQEELIATFFIYANLKWSKQILELNPGASKGKFHLSNLMRFADGIFFLFINTTLLLQATQILGAFLNFAALGFLSEIDNVALRLARDGYLTESLERVAGDVLLMKLPKNHNDTMQVMDSVMIAILFFATLIGWILMMFVL